MKGYLFAVMIAVAAPLAHSAQAYWTGAMRIVTTMGGAPGIACEYRHQHSTFWVTFSGGASSCPYSVEVQ